MKNRIVLVRTYSAGVHYGTFQELNGTQLLLTNARRIWSWTGAFTLSAIAVNGCGKGSCLSIAVPEILLTEAIEIIPMSEQAITILNSL